MGAVIYKAIILSLVLLAGMLNTALAAEDSSGPPAGILEKLDSFIDGTLEYRLYPYLRRFRDDDAVVNEFLLNLRIRNRLGENFEYYLEPRVITDDDHLSSGSINDFLDDDIRRNVFNLNEWYLRFKKGNFTATAGKQIFSWGTAETFNPTDYLNARDFTDFIENEKIGSPSLALNYSGLNWKADFILIPFFTPARLPLRDTRWSPLPEYVPVPINDRLLPKRSLNNAQFAGRLGGTLGGWDFTASYYDGFESVPAGLINMVLPPSVTPVYDRVRIYGSDFSTTFGGLELHGETAYYKRDNRGRDDYLQYLLGGTYTFFDILSTHDLKATLEYAREEVTRRGTEDYRYVDIELSHVFRNSLMSKFTYEFDDRKKFEIGSIYNINHRDYVIQPRFCYKPRDNWEIEVGFDILGGASDTLFGRYSKNDRGFLKSKFSF